MKKYRIVSVLILILLFMARRSPKSGPSRKKRKKNIKKPSANAKTFEPVNRIDNVRTNRVRGIEAPKSRGVIKQVGLETWKKVTLLVGSVSLLTALYLTLNEREDSNSQDGKARVANNHPVNSTESDNQIKAPDVIDSAYSVPTFKFVQENYSFPGPDLPSIADEKFQRISLILAESIKVGIADYLLPAIEKDPENKNKLVLGFYNEIVSNFRYKSHPDIGKEIEQFLNGALDPDRLLEHINKYINSGGYFLIGDVKTREKLFQYHPIEGTFFVEMDDENGVEKIPIIKLGKDLAGFESDLMGSDIVATTDSLLNHALVLNENVDPTVKRLYKKFGIEKQGINYEGFQKMLVDDFIRHEATHIFLKRRFPNSSHPSALNLAHDISADMTNLSENDVYSPLMIHELCALGTQLASSDSPIPYWRFTVSERAQAEARTYKLAWSVLPYALVEAAKSSAMKRQIMHAMKSGVVPFAQIQHLISSMTLEETRAAGEIMYKMGYGLLDKVEKGDL